MVNPWELHCLRSVRGEWLYLGADSSGAATSVTGHLVELHLVTSRTTNEDYYSEYAIPSNETKPPGKSEHAGKAHHAISSSESTSGYCSQEQVLPHSTHTKLG